jgi:DNA-binding NarL/FixJ family response regulator
MDKITILIADDHSPFRSGLRALLESSQDILVVGEAESGAEAVTQAAALQPDVILMDIQMSDINGIEATRRILHTSPHIAILILTMFEDDDFVFSALRAGARGYLLKGTMKADLLRAIHAASSGEAIFGATIAKRLVTFFANIQQPRLPQVFPELSNREREILDLVAQGYKNPEIADKLVLSPKTVRNHVSNILSKLQVADRAQAILKARQAGFGNNDS